MEILQPAKVETTYRHKKTGEQYLSDEEWKSKGVSEEDIQRDVTIVMPSLDFTGKTK